MIKLAIFDIDETIAKINVPIKKTTLKLLNKLSSLNVTIAFASGKPVDYVFGMIRQMGLENIIAVGDNGYKMYIGGKFPPQQIINLDISKDKQKQIQNLHNEASKESFFTHENLWIQSYDPFIVYITKNKDEKLNNSIVQFFENKLAEEKYKDLEMYKHSHCEAIEVLIKNINKGTAVEKLMQHYNLTADEVVTVGNGVNDVPMFDKTKLSIGINLPERFLTKAKLHFTDIDEAIKFIIKNK